MLKRSGRRRPLNLSNFADPLVGSGLYTVTFSQIDVKINAAGNLSLKLIIIQHKVQKDYWGGPNLYYTVRRTVKKIQ